MNQKANLIHSLLTDLTRDHTQTWVAGETGIHQSLICRILNGQIADPSSSKLSAVIALHTKLFGKKR